MSLNLAEGLPILHFTTVGFSKNRCLFAQYVNEWNDNRSIAIHVVSSS